MNTVVDLPSHPCYLNGDFVPLNQARISVLDRGFIFGDGIYEVVPVYGGIPFRWAQHHARMMRSLREVRIPHHDDALTWRHRIDALVDQHAQAQGIASSNLDQFCYLQITRGVAMRDHVINPDLQPTVFAMVSNLKSPSPAQISQGVACVSLQDFRWEKGHIKTVSLLAAILARDVSVQAKVTETIMFRNGHLTEASSSNVWVVKNGCVLAPPKNNLVLEGIRYSLLESLCQQVGLPFELRPITWAEVLDADELMLTSATKEVLAITSLDGQAVGHGQQTGRPGPVFAKLHAAYQSAKARSAASNGLESA